MRSTQILLSSLSIRQAHPRAILGCRPRRNLFSWCPSPFGSRRRWSPSWTHAGARTAGTATPFQPTPHARHCRAHARAHGYPELDHMVVAIGGQGRAKRGQKDPRGQWFSRPLRGSTVLYAGELAAAAAPCVCRRDTVHQPHVQIDTPVPLCQRHKVLFTCTASIARMKLVGSGGKRKGGLGRAFKEHKARLYIIRRCVVMLLRWDD
ncbi:hypothetical protein HU200_050454 [Digitaria exilis]|uniref:Uncharacterized protein n=1 Tax=Digitaria exilis TaxID=1010633 RepID=A0A835EAD9_9POAL|nr:hypothetical protein HU200_050454 [Digitaria exilis]